MITLKQINQYANTHSICDNTNLFSILSQMQIEYKEQPLENVQAIPSASKIEYTTEDLLDLFNS